MWLSIHSSEQFHLYDETQAWDLLHPCETLDGRRNNSEAQRELVGPAPIASQWGRLFTFLHAFEFLLTGNIAEMLKFLWPFLHSDIHIYFIIGEGSNNKLRRKENCSAVQFKIYVSVSSFK